MCPAAVCTAAGLDIFNLSLQLALVLVCPVALTPVIMKCFERIVLRPIEDVIPMTLDRHQVAYRENRPTGDAVSPAPHMALTHLEHPNPYIRMPFVDFGFSFQRCDPGQAETEAPPWTG